jgi:hypothetical protein
LKRCVQCGQTLTDEAGFCHQCGGSNFEPVADSGGYQQPPQTEYYQQPIEQPVQQQYYQQPVQQPVQQQYYQQPGQQPYYPQQAGAPYQQDHPSKGAAVASLVLGIISLVVAWFGWGAIVAIIMSIIGIVLGINARKQLLPEQGRGMATAGLVCSIIALALSAIVFVSCVICASALTGWGLNNSWMY